MAVSKTYGMLSLASDSKGRKIWLIENAEPHVCIRIKSVFPKLPKAVTKRFELLFTEENSHELKWFITRYPLNITDGDLAIMEESSDCYQRRIEDTERIFAPDYTPIHVELNEGEQARNYQIQAKDFWLLRKRYLLGDDMGLGKTASAIFGMASGCIPALVVCQTHLAFQWAEEIKKFTNLRTHIITKRKTYKLPPVDVYVISYSKLSGWVDIFSSADHIIKALIFDECQELRRVESNKYKAAQEISKEAEYCMGLSGTPIYNYGGEIFNVLNCIYPDCLGTECDFNREWCRWEGHWLVVDTKALGTYLRDNALMLRRTRAEVGKELPEINKIIHTIEHDQTKAEDALELAKQLAIKATTGHFTERGQASMQLDLLMRHATGVAKAKYVAAFVRILLDEGETVLLAGWHRDVYDIWSEELKQYHPVFYTGSESPSQKRDSKEMFIAGKSNLLIMSLRSGVGVDGLQYRCNNVVFGELDWSGKVHDQFTARVDRDGSTKQVNAYYLVTDFGSDPVMVDVLGLKSMQSQGIVDPLLDTRESFSDDSRLKLLANSFLNKQESFNV